MACAAPPKGGASAGTGSVGDERWKPGSEPHEPQRASRGGLEFIAKNLNSSTLIT